MANDDQIILGVSVTAGCMVVAAILVLGILLWRRKKKEKDVMKTSLERESSQNYSGIEEAEVAQQSPYGVSVTTQTPHAVSTQTSRVAAGPQRSADDMSGAHHQPYSYTGSMDLSDAMVFGGKSAQQEVTQGTQTDDAFPGYSALLPVRLTNTDTHLKQKEQIYHQSWNRVHSAYHSYPRGADRYRQELNTNAHARPIYDAGDHSRDAPVYAKVNKWPSYGEQPADVKDLTRSFEDIIASRSAPGNQFAFPIHGAVVDDTDDFASLSDLSEDRQWNNPVRNNLVNMNFSRLSQFPGTKLPRPQLNL